MIRFFKQSTRSRQVSALRSGGKSASRLARSTGRTMVESLEQRQLLTLLGIAPLTELPIQFYNSTGQLSYEPSTQQFDVAATPTTVFLSSGPISLENPQHGDIQIHAKIDASGNLVRGANPGDSAVLGSVNSSGDDLVINGSLDLDGNGTIDPSESGVVLSGELVAIGFEDSGVGDTTDSYDFRFHVTGGILQPYFTGRDIGVLLTSEHSSFDGSFAISFTGGAKGTLGPTTPPPPELGSLSGTKYLDECGNGLDASDSPLAGTTIYLDLNGNSSLDSGEPSQATGANGQYRFDGLTPGQYTVREVVPSGYVRTGPVLVNGHTVTVVAGQDSGGNDFANAELCDKNVLCNITYTINGCRTVTNLRGNTNQGDQVCVTFTVRAGYEPHRFTLVSYTAPGSTFVAADADLQEIFDIDTGVFGPGQHTLCVNIPDCYYQIDFVCGCAIDRFGPEGSNIFYSAQNRLFSADNDGRNACRPNPCLVSGASYIDLNNNGQQDSGETGLAGVTVTLTGTNTYGESINIARTTGDDGLYTFGNLAAGTYRVTESQPAQFNNGQTTTTTNGAVVTSNRVSNIVLGGGLQSTDNNFAELNIGGANAILQGDTATVGFYSGSSGVALINALNGSSSSRSLGNYLSSVFPKLWGSQAGSTNNLAGKTNSQVSSYYASLYAQTDRSDAQVLALAISTYASSTRYAGGDFAARYGFGASANGDSTKTINVGGNGSTFGVSNNANVTLLQLLQSANSRAFNGDAFGSLGSTTKANAVAIITNANNFGQLV